LIDRFSENIDLVVKHHGGETDNQLKRKLNDHQQQAGGFNSLGGLNRRLKEKASERRWF
jgi:hypothetical protein